MSPEAEAVFLWLKDAGNPEKAAFLQGFFKTGPGEYGEGDLFLGVTVPQQRLIAKTLAPQAALPLLSELLQHPYHEMRLTGLLALVYRYEKTKQEAERRMLVDFYLGFGGYFLFPNPGGILLEKGKVTFFQPSRISCPMETAHRHDWCILLDSERGVY